MGKRVNPLPPIMIHLKQLLGCLAILKTKVGPARSDPEVRVRGNMEEHAERIDRLFLDGCVLEVEVRPFRQTESVPWMSLENSCVVAGVEPEAK